MRLCIYILMFQINVKSEIHFYFVFFIEKMIKNGFGHDKKGQNRLK